MPNAGMLPIVLTRPFYKTLTLALLLLLAACAPPIPAPDHPNSPAPRADGLTHEQAQILDSLQLIDDYPLYVMRHTGPYETGTEVGLRPEPVEGSTERSSQTTTARIDAEGNPWGCSLFAALHDPQNALFGRNFDWQFSPALLLFTAPPDAYASVSMVDIDYLGFEGAASKTILDLPLAERADLLSAPFLPFDGMNETGLAVGMAAVPPGQGEPDPDKPAIGSLGIIRRILDHAATVDEAVEILQSYNIDMGGGPDIHYLIADAAGQAALAEFYDGELVVIPNDEPWHQATNFLRAQADETGHYTCWRYDILSQRLGENEGQMTAESAAALLAEVQQTNTQWSIVYGMSSGEIGVRMGREGGEIHTFALDKTPP